MNSGPIIKVYFYYFQETQLNFPGDQPKRGFFKMLGFWARNAFECLKICIFNWSASGLAHAENTKTKTGERPRSLGKRNSENFSLSAFFWWKKWWFESTNLNRAWINLRTGNKISKKVQNNLKFIDRNSVSACDCVETTVTNGDICT